MPHSRGNRRPRQWLGRGSLPAAGRATHGQPGKR
jgi:hypothetical protein